MADMGWLTVITNINRENEIGGDENGRKKKG
jgi:hypothetical protein